MNMTEGILDSIKSRFPEVRIEKRRHPSFQTQVFWPFAFVVLSLFIGAILILSAGVNPIEGYYHLFMGALGTKLALTDTFWRFTPLLLTGTAVAIAFKAKFWNIGAEGQMLAGAIPATWLAMSFVNVSPFLLIPLVITVGFLGGAFWAFIPAILRTKWGVDEVVTTLLGNWIVIYFAGALVEGPWRNPVSNWPESAAIVPQARFPRLFSGYRLHFGVFVAIFFAIIFYIIIKRTKWGYELQAVGSSPEAASFAGINVTRTIIVVALLSGGIAGIAGVNELCGTFFHLKGVGTGGIGVLTQGLGYAGIYIAMLGGLSPRGVPISAFFIATIIKGSDALYRQTGVPSAFSDAMEGIILVCLLIGLFFTRYRLRRVER